MTQFTGIIGYPLQHSISPYFQQAALDYFELDIRYRVWETKAEDLSNVIRELKSPQNLGLNVTIPYKEEVIQLLDDVDPIADIIGAVNTIVNQDGRLLGYNTDGYGFIQALTRHANFELSDKRVILLGAGGAARGVCFSLIKERIASLTIINRTIERAESLADSLAKYIDSECLPAKVMALPYEFSRIKEIIGDSHLIVNCTNMGMKYSVQEKQSPLASELIPQNALVYDLVYNPVETPLLKLAREAGALVLGGLPMLIYQGAASFKLWLGKNAPLDIMFSAARKALEDN